MPGKRHFRFLVIATLAALVVTLEAALPRVSADGDEDKNRDMDQDQARPIPDKAELKYPNLGSHLDQLAARVEEGETTAEDAAAGASMHREESVAVTIYLSSNVDEVVAFLEENGGDPRNVGEDYIEAYVPVSLLGPVSEQPEVIRVREIVPPQPDFGDFTSQGVPAHGSSAWHRAGYTGRGVKVGIIDGGFEGFGGLMGTELSATVQARCYTEVGVFTQNLTDCEDDDEEGDNHGTRVAETVMDIAPEVSLYIANPISRGDSKAVVDWMVSEGVSVINRSQSSVFDGPGDGTYTSTDSPLRNVDRAVDGGMTWVNSAGNGARTTWFGEYSDANGNGWIEFAGNDSGIDMQLEADDEITVQLRWEGRWDGENSDFNLFVVDDVTKDRVASSTDPQSGEAGHYPYERLRYEIPSDGKYDVFVQHVSGSVPDWIQVMVWGVGSIQHATGHHSITSPGEGKNPGMLAVGAAPWYDVHTIEPYSSRGPTPDGRVKPDIVGATCGETALRPLNQYDRAFCGTSQAAPHVAGLTALVKQRFPSYTPAQVAAYLKDNSDPRGDAPNKHTWGHGFAWLPSSNQAASPDRNVLIALYRATGGEDWTKRANWLSEDAPIALWQGVTTDIDGRVTRLNLGDNHLTGEIPPELGSLGNLTVLNLNANQLTGPIPTELRSLSNLEELYLWGNKLSGEIPSELGSLSNLEVLSLSDNQLTGEIPSELGSLTDLEVLSLSDNQLTGEIPPELGSLATLERLRLFNNQLTGEIPAELESLTNLAHLRLDGNELTGEIPSELGNLANLAVLSLSDNQLSGMVPQTLAGLTMLESFSFYNNLSLCAPVDDAFQTWLRGISIVYGSSCAQADSPEDRAVLVQVHSATDSATWTNSANWLSEHLTREWYGVTNDANGRVHGLFLGGNQLTGKIPSELGSLANLRSLSLRDNQLTGEIPAELGRLTNLTVLYLSGNQLTGCVPASFRDVADNDFAQLGLSFCTSQNPLVARYDANGNGTIEKSEVIKAINDYLFGEGEPITKAEVIKLINLYLFGPGG